ncbi:MAG: hypothetical protein LBC76_06225 [Treponema sp.]|jgi:hypothetical protein|nr:hypothetical protein [Treponema sp.]
MSFFCLLWVPLFYLLRRSFTGTSGSGSVWALLLGSITAIIQFFLGYFVNPGGFGFSRWLFGFIDIVSLTVLVPLLIYLLLMLFSGFSGDMDFANFAMLWLIPVAAMRALSWSSANEPILLVAVPLLWTALAIGIPFFINWMLSNFRWYTAIISIICILVLPIAASTAYWAFFSQQTALGFLLFFVTQIPLVFSLTLDILHS